MVIGLLDILRRESEQNPVVYLYEENGYWYAYEHSAHLICELLQGLVSIERVIYDTYLSLSCVEIELELQILERCSIVSCSDTELMISFPNSSKRVA